MDSRMEKAEALFHAYCTTETLPQLTEHASEIIGMPLHITDHSYKLLTQANLDFAVEEDMVWRDTAELGYLSSGIIANVVRNHRNNKPVRPGERIRFVWSSKQSTYPMLVYYLYHLSLIHI